MAVVHNGVIIHQDQEVPSPTGGAMARDQVSRAPLMLQDHGNPVRYRNIWVIDLPGER
jgi:hypothetical protein